MTEILRCTTCKTFTLHTPCKCGSTAITIKPAKYTSKYASYRRQAKEQERKQQGLL